MTKRTAAALAALTFLLAGCGGDDSSAADLNNMTDAWASEVGATPKEYDPVEPVDPGDPVDDPAPMDRDDAFVMTVHNDTDIYDYDSDASLINLGHTVCEAFDRGLTFFDVVDAMGSSNDNEAAFVVGAAVTVYCPEHQSEIGR